MLLWWRHCLHHRVRANEHPPLLVAYFDETGAVARRLRVHACTDETCFVWSTRQRDVFMARRVGQRDGVTPRLENGRKERLRRQAPDEPPIDEDLIQNRQTENWTVGQ